MKNLKNILAAIILLSTLTTTILTASTPNEIESNCFFNGPVLSLEIPALNLSTDIQLLHSMHLSMAMASMHLLLLMVSIRFSLSANLVQCFTPMHDKINPTVC